ncbi:MAG TPA: VOC family protein [Geobacteraceae bacterium]|nr:VOC family protein [Geobacteraceae bacterium]
MERGGAKASLQLAVADLNATEAFYGGILELPVQRAFTARGAPEHLILKHDDWDLLFVEESAVIHVYPLLEERLTSFPKGVGLTLHFRVKEIEDIYEAVLAEELEILYPLDEKPYGVKDFWCFDPDGYLVVLEEPWG